MTTPSKEACIESALRRMQYRQETPNKWAKPVGLQLFTFDMCALTWSNWFKSLQGIAVWESRSICSEGTHGSYLSQIKAWECETRTDLRQGQADPGEFHLSDPVADFGL